ncbi:unnamed protein product [Durusdinium trenchii]|uniref:Kinesin-like protein n=1 Tax=Durusdinium trenchii TaxID=1381693 RepID=A0ABP0SB98_9DINO
MAMRIPVRHMSGKVTVVEVSPDTTIGKLKMQMRAWLPCEDELRGMSTLELSLGETRLTSNDQTIHEAGISENTALQDTHQTSISPLSATEGPARTHPGADTTAAPGGTELAWAAHVDWVQIGDCAGHFACRNLHPHEVTAAQPLGEITEGSGCPTRQSPEGLIDRRDQSTRDPMPAMRIQVMKLSKAQEVFQNAGVDSFLDSVLEGYHATVFAYGQTGSGKTHTMEGFVYQAGTQSKAPQVKPALTAPEKLGIVPRCIEGLFQRMEQQSLAGDCSFTFRLSFLQIYNENFGLQVIGM